MSPLKSSVKLGRRLLGFTSVSGSVMQWAWVFVVVLTALSSVQLSLTYYINSIVIQLVFTENSSCPSFSDFPSIVA